VLPPLLLRLSETRTSDFQRARLLGSREVAMCWLQESTQLWSYPTFLLIPLMIIGGVECFIGCRAWRLLLGLNGAVLGFVGGAMFAAFVGVPLLIFVGALSGAVAGATLFSRANHVGGFVFVFGSMFSLTLLLAHLADAPPRMLMSLASAAGLAGGLAALTAWRPWLIAVTSVAGAQQIASAWRAHELVAETMPSQEAITASELSVFLALAAAGLILQFADAILFSRRSGHQTEAAARQPTSAVSSHEQSEFDREEALVCGRP
jgi:hypothetical protein